MKTATHDLTIGEFTVHKRFLTWSDGEASREWAMLSLLAEHSPGVAPRPIQRAQDGDAPVIVMERLPGAPLSARDFNETIVAELGLALNRVYQVPLASAHEAGLPERRVGPTKIVRMLQYELNQLRDVSACADSGLVSEALDAARDYTARPDAHLTPRLTSIGIADLNPANVLWDGHVCRLVDFEDGGLTEPAFEIADHVEHIANRREGRLSAGALGKAVGLSDEDVVRVNQYRVLWASFWLLMLLPGNGAFSRNPSGTTEDQARHLLHLLAVHV